jgi:hypothetical protein
MTMAQVLILVGAGAGAALGQFGVTAAYRYAEPRSIAVYDYTNVIFTALFGFAFFGQVPDALSVVGFAVILLAAFGICDARAVVRSAEELVVPGGMRSLAAGDGRYRGVYTGDEDTSRKQAYHNGTAWTWQMPLFPEAYYITHGRFGRATAISLLSSMSVQLDNGCIMHMPEILDGDYPHKPRGCDAQAWGLSEYYRVWKLLHPASKSAEKDHE